MSDDAEERSVGEQVRGLVMEALVTDGGHHKQWYLAEIAKLVLSPFELEHFQADYEYETGSPP